MRLRTLGLAFAIITSILGLCIGGAQAGTYYTYQDSPAYWWYAQEDPAFWLLVPSDAFSYRDVDLFGVKGVDLVLREGGPYIQVRRIRTTDVDKIWNSVREAWAPSLRDSRVTTNQQITTSNNIRARFRVLEGTTLDGAPVMVRFVAFTRDNYTVYLTYLGTRAAYAGKVRDAWLQAVNTFTWR